jgi:hypothetical protein
MFVLDITPEQCERVQEELKEIISRSPDPDISILLEQLEISSCSSSHATQVEYSRSTSPDAHTNKKRVMSPSSPTTHTSKKRALGTRNDSGRHHHRKAVVTPFFQQPLHSANQHYDFDNESELSSLSSSGSDTALLSDKSESRSESDAESGTQWESKTDKPRPPAKAREPKQNSWEEVDNVLEITDAAANVLQSLATIGDEANLSRLLALKDEFSLQGAQIAEPATITLAYLVKRARSSDVQMVRQKFKHIVDLMQLSVWLDQ